MAATISSAISSTASGATSGYTTSITSGHSTSITTRASVAITGVHPLHKFDITSAHLKQYTAHFVSLLIKHNNLKLDSDLVDSSDDPLFGPVQGPDCPPPTYPKGFSLIVHHALGVL